MIVPATNGAVGFNADWDKNSSWKKRTENAADAHAKDPNGESAVNPARLAATATVTRPARVPITIRE